MISKSTMAGFKCKQVILFPLLVCLSIMTLTEKGFTQNNKASVHFNKTTYFSYSKEGVSDSVPLKIPGSGSNMIGLSYQVFLGQSFYVRTGTEFNLFRLSFDSKDEKKFPFLGAQHEEEKMRFYYVQTPIGIGVNFQEQQKSSWHLELGWLSAFLLGSSQKLKYHDVQYNQIVKLKTTGIAGATPVRFATFSRVGKGPISFYALYWLNSLFKEDKLYNHPDQQEAVAFPVFPALEIGLTVNLYE